MNTNKHSPAPWMIFESGNHNFLDEKSVVIADSSGIQIAAACTGTREEEANDRLIAAAPDLLAALSDLLEGQTIEGLRGHTGMMDICVSGADVTAGLNAIAKAVEP